MEEGGSGRLKTEAVFGIQGRRAGSWRERDGGPAWREEVVGLGHGHLPYQPAYDGSIGPHPDEQVLNVSHA